MTAFMSDMGKAGRIKRLLIRVTKDMLSPHRSSDTAFALFAHDHVYRGNPSLFEGWVFV